MRLDTDKFMDWMVELIMDNLLEKTPYKDTRISDTEWIREFNPSITDSEEYVWHRDRTDRTVIVLEGSDWQFQFDNELPSIINKGDKLYIPRMIYHRLLPGTTNLKLKITES